MKISDKGIELIKFFEGCKLTAYQDTGGVWTIGAGHTKNVYKGQVITDEIADAMLKTDLLDAEKRVDVNLDILNLEVNQNEYDALVSLAYNLKSFEQLIGHLANSRLKFKEKMLLYFQTVGSKKGLKIRRIAERLLFEGNAWKLIAKRLRRLNLHQIVDEEEKLFRQNVEDFKRKNIPS